MRSRPASAARGVVQKLDDQWEWPNLPVLVEVTRRINAGKPARASDVAPVVGTDLETVRLAGKALERLGMATTHRTATDLYFTNVTREAYIATGLHPGGDDVVLRLVEALRQAADRVDDPAEKGRLRTLADQAGNVSRDVLAGVLTALVTAGIGAA